MKEFIEIRLLRYFIAVANQQSISAVSQYLHLSQQSLLRQLSLEKFLIR
ncbi:LysR family transcriptional regulator [Peribacillus sp. NPDC060253]